MPAEFDGVLAYVDRIPGWLTRDQAAVLWQEAARLGPAHRIVEIGSHQGRSTIVLASATTALVTAIDPFLPDWKYGDERTFERFTAHLADARVAARVEVLADRSTALRPGWSAPVELLYIDGKHDYWTASDDLRWSDHLPEGGRLLVHDTFSSIGVTTAVLRHLMFSRRLRYLDRTGSLARFEVASPGPRDRFRMLCELPWWFRNIVIKVLLRLRLRRVAGLLGHHQAPDPF